MTRGSPDPAPRAPAVRRGGGSSGLPAPAAAGSRQASRLSRQRRDDAEASGGDRSCDAVLRRGERERPSRRALAQRARDRGLRGGARHRRAVPERARTPTEIVFVRGTTEAINLVAQTYGRAHVGRGDEIVISAMEHHSNIVPWQILCEQTGRAAPHHPDQRRGRAGSRCVRERCLTDRTRIVSIAHVSNVLGTVNPVEEIVRLAHRRGHPGARRRRAGGRAHGRRRAGAGMRFLRALRPQDVRPDRHRRALRDVVAARRDAAVSERRRHDQLGDLRADALQRAAVPIRGRNAAHRGSRRPRGGDRLSHRASASSDRDATSSELLEYATAPCREVPGVRVIGTAAERAGILSFVLDGVHPHDVGTILDREGVAIRTGHHCCQPLMDRLGLPATARASLALYNTREDIDALVAALHKVRSCSDDIRPRGALPGRDSRPQQATAELSRARSRRARPRAPTRSAATG